MFSSDNSPFDPLPGEIRCVLSELPVRASDLPVHASDLSAHASDLPHRVPMPAPPVIRVLPGVPRSATAARQVTRQLLGPRHPAADTAMLLVSELITNSVTHSQSARPGGTVTLAVCAGPTSVLIQVRDDGGPDAPRLLAGHASAEYTTTGNLAGARAESGRASGDDRVTADGEHGYGLLLVDALAETWGTIVTPDCRVTWCRLAVERSSEGTERS